MTNQYDDLTPETAAHMLYHLGEGGHPAGSFVTSLMDLIGRADPNNRIRLSLGFPGYVMAYDVAHADHGLKALRVIAAGNTALDEFGARRMLDLMRRLSRANAEE